MNIQNDNIDEMCEDLERYAKLEGAEVGEVCDLLISLAGYESYVGDEFYNALKKEIGLQLDYFKKNCIIVKRTETETHTYYELESV